MEKGGGEEKGRDNFESIALNYQLIGGKNEKDFIKIGC